MKKISSYRCHACGHKRKSHVMVNDFRKKCRTKGCACREFMIIDPSQRTHLMPTRSR